MAYERNSSRWICATVFVLILIFISIKIRTTPRNIPYTENSEIVWTILLTVNDGYFDFFQNWIHFYNKLHLNYKLIVIAEDSVAYSRLQQIDNSLRLTVVRGWLNAVGEAVDYGSEAFKKLASGRPTYILKYLEKGLNIVYADVDAVWLQNPFPYFSGSFDILMQLDGPNNLCTGLMAVKSNNESIKFMKSWEASLKKHLQTQQTALNEVVKGPHLRLKALDTNIFPSGELYFGPFTDEKRKSVVIVHNNFIVGHPAKLQRFKQYKLWFS